MNALVTGAGRIADEKIDAKAYRQATATALNEDARGKRSAGRKFGGSIGLFAVLWMCIGVYGFAQEKPPASSAAPDVLIFANGDHLTGKLERATGGNVVFKSDMAGELTIPFDKVKELHSGTTFVALPGGEPAKKVKPLATGTVAKEDKNLTLTPETGAPQTIPLSSVGYLIDAPEFAREIARNPGIRRGWSGAATGGFTLVRSTQTSSTFTALLNAVRQVPTVDYLRKRNRTIFNIVETYGTNSSPVIPPTIPFSPPVTVKTSIFHADGERDEYVNTRLYYLGDLSFDHNFSQGLQLQQTYGAGLGWMPIQDAKQELDLKGEIHYERQQFIQTPNTAPQPELDLFGSTFQENYRRNLPHKMALTEWANILPAWNNLQAYSANAYVGLALPLYRRLNITLSATDNYLNNPATYFRTNSVQYVTGVTYVFK